MTGSLIYFPLASNASALFAGPGVAGVRRRILTAALLMDHVVLESGVHSAFAGPGGASSMTAHGQPGEWQTTKARGAATGSRHYVQVRRDSAPNDAPFHPLVVTDANFSWRATFEPFRRELPGSAASWLEFGFVQDEGPAKAIVAGWQSADRDEEFRQYRRGAPPEPSDGVFVNNAIVAAGYHDLAVAAVTHSAISVDRRHALAVQKRLEAGDADRLGGHYALEVLLPTDYAWTDVPDLRKHRALREYRAVIREIEAAALTSSSSPATMDDQVRRQYTDRVARAAAKGVPFKGRVALAAIGFVAGYAADSVAPIVGGAVATGAMFGVGEAADRLARPRWLAVDRKLRGPRNGL